MLRENDVEYFCANEVGRKNEATKFTECEKILIQKFCYCTLNNQQTTMIHSPLTITYSEIISLVASKKEKKKMRLRPNDSLL